MAPAPKNVVRKYREIVGDEAADAADEQTHHHGSPWVARVGRTSLAREGEPVELAVSTQHLHFFDLDTGAAIYGDDATKVDVAPAATAA